MAIAFQIFSLDRDAAGTISVRTYDGHTFGVGDKVRFFNAMGGGSYPFMAGNPYRVTTIGTVIMSADGKTVERPSQTFKVVQAGATEAASTQGTIAISAGTPYQGSYQYWQITTAVPHGFTVQPSVKIRGVTSTAISAELLGRFNDDFRPSDIQVLSTTQLVVRISRPVIGAPVINWTNASLLVWPTGVTVASDDGIRGASASIGAFTVTAVTSKTKSKGEAQIVGAVLQLASNSKGIDYPFKRLFNTLDVSRIFKSRTKLTKLKIVSQAQTLRSAMDLVIENYQNADLKPRRFYVNQEGQFVYEVTNDVKPTTATAPYKIVLAGAGTPNTSTAAASVAPSDFAVELDHDGTKRALFRGPTTDEGPIADLIKFDSPDAMGTAYTRVGAPYFDEVVDYPNGVTPTLLRRQQAARTFFTERSLPIQTISFTLKGAGTASWNNLGFSAGYAQITPPISVTCDVNAITYSGGTVLVTTWPLDNGIVPGMNIVLANIRNTGVSGTYTVAGTTNQPYPFSFTFFSAAATATVALFDDDCSLTIYGKYERTGTAPNQIVTVTLPTQHGLSTGASVTVTGLTGAAGTSMNTTATATVVDDYSFTYPSAGTNGTATGVGTISAITLVPRWQPGQWVDITAAEFGLADLYRIEQVDWGFEPGAFLQTIRVTCNRRNPKTITKLSAREQRGG